jgi:hypothetical protein
MYNKILNSSKAIFSVIKNQGICIGCGERRYYTFYHLQKLGYAKEPLIALEEVNKALGVAIGNLVQTELEKEGLAWEPLLRTEKWISENGHLILRGHRDGCYAILQALPGDLRLIADSYQEGFGEKLTQDMGWSY